jgi:hypothetical protein
MRIGSIGKDFMDINSEPAQGERSKPEREQKQPREKKAFHSFTASNFMKVLFQGIRN